MPIQPKSCFEVVCDQVDTDPGCDGGWDEGAPHFETAEEAAAYATTYAGFVITGATVLCDKCSAKRDCDRLGHKWEEWREGEYFGVTFQRRFCDHCGASEYSPEFQQAVLLREAADAIDHEAFRIEQEHRGG